MALVETERSGAVLVVRMDNPPVNALGYGAARGADDGTSRGGG